MTRPLAGNAEQITGQAFRQDNPHGVEFHAQMSAQRTVYLLKNYVRLTRGNGVGRPPERQVAQGIPHRRIAGTGVYGKRVRRAAVFYWMLKKADFGGVSTLCERRDGIRPPPSNHPPQCRFS